VENFNTCSVMCTKLLQFFAAFTVVYCIICDPCCFKFMCICTVQVLCIFLHQNLYPHSPMIDSLQRLSSEVSNCGWCGNFESHSFYASNTDIAGSVALFNFIWCNRLLQGCWWKFESIRISGTLILSSV